MGTRSRIANLETGTLPVLNVAQRYGARPDAAARANDEAFARALADAVDGAAIYLPPLGTYEVSAPWLIENVRGLRIFGGGGREVGSRRSRLRWVGEAETFLRFVGSRDCQVHDLEITLRDAAGVHVDDVMRFETRANATSSNHELRNVFITGPAGKRYDRGVAWVEGTGGDAGNDLCRLEGVICTNYADAGFDVTHPQSTGHKFRACSGGGGPRLLRTVAAFDWDGGTSAAGNADADFKVVGAATTQQSRITNFRSEKSGCFLDLAIGSSSMSLEVSNCSFQTNALRADNRMVSWVGRGEIAFRNCKLGNGTSLAGEVYLSSSGNRNAIRVSFDECRIESSLANPFTALPPKAWRNLTTQSAAGVRDWGAGYAMGPHQRIVATGQRSRAASTIAGRDLGDVPDTAQTTDATTTTVLEQEIPAGFAGRVRYEIVGRKSTGEFWACDLAAFAENNAGTITLSGATPTYTDPAELSYSASLTTSGSNVVVQVTGQASHTTRWVCRPSALCLAF